jgi:putative ABC transport system substrate-binding protein
MTTRRRVLIAGAVSVMASAIAIAQPQRPRIGIVAGIPREKSVATPMLLERLAELGYRDRAAPIVDYQYAARPDHYAGLARRLVDRGSDLIVVVANGAMARAVRDTGTSIPIVVIAIEYDPVAAGLVHSLARPGGNITGVYTPSAALLGKRLEVAQQLLPGANSFLVLSDRFSRSQAQGLREAADARGLRLTVIEFSGQPYDLAGAFEAGRDARAEGVFLLLAPEFIARRKELSALLERHRLPGFASDAMADDPGILASYSVDTRKFVGRAAEMCARILKGGKPGDMPLEQPSEYSIVINLRTARRLGIGIPPAVMMRATRLIE